MRYVETEDAIATQRKVVHNMQKNFDQAFSRLLASWRRHEELRVSGAPYADRLDANSDLFNARVEMARARQIY